MAKFDVIYCDNYKSGLPITKRSLKSSANDQGIKDLDVQTVSDLNELSSILEQQRDCNKLLVISNQYPSAINPILEKWSSEHNGSYLSVLHSGSAEKIPKADSVDGIETLPINNGLNPFKIFRGVGTWHVAIPKLLAKCNELFK